MFIDYLHCEYDLPVSGFIDQFQEAPTDWSEIEFQTDALLRRKEFPGFEKYTISVDGQLYKEILDYEKMFGKEDEDSCDLEFGCSVGKKDFEIKEIRRIDFTGEVDFSTTVPGEKTDGFVEFLALFYKGELKELECKEFKAIDNSKRIEFEKKLKGKITELRKKSKSYWYKFYLAYKKAVSFLFNFIRVIIFFIEKVLFRIEKWIT